MAVQPILNPKFRAFDANGDPLSGGLLYSYSAGTSTPLATYTTRAGDVANANPVVLDANGEADVWCTPNVSYKFVLKSSAGVTQWTVDNVPALPDLSLGFFELGDGTVAAPALSFINDPDCGLYRIASETIGLATNGAERQRWNTSGTEITGNVSLTGADPASTTGFDNTLTPLNLVKAWGRVTTNGTGGATVVAGFNVSGATVDNAGITCTLATPLTTAGVAIATLATSSGSFASCGTAVTTNLKIYRYDAMGGTPIDPSANAFTVQFIVLGAQ